MRALAVFVLALTLLRAENWPSFRGLGARGVAENSSLPVSWNVETGANVAWKPRSRGSACRVRSSGTTGSSLPRQSAPIPTWSSSKLKGERDDRQDPMEQEFRVLALDKRTGRIVWNQLASRAKPCILRHPHNSYASPTPATDGTYLVAFFGSEGLYCYDLDGHLRWKKDLGALDQGAFDVPDYQWGSASSPILWNGKVLLQVDLHKDSFLAAFDARSGRELWRTPRDVKPAWSSPTVVTGPTRTEIVTNGVEHVIGYEAETGKELWRLKGTSMISVPTPFVHDGLIYVFTGYYRYQRRSYAIRPGATGDITDSKEFIAWMREEAPYLSTPVVCNGLVYAYGNRGSGILNVYDARTGVTVYQQRLGAGTGASSSPITTVDRVYAINEDGDVYVIGAGRTYRELG